MIEGVSSYGGRASPGLEARRRSSGQMLKVLFCGLFGYSLQPWFESSRSGFRLSTLL